MVFTEERGRIDNAVVVINKSNYQIKTKNSFISLFGIRVFLISSFLWKMQRENEYVVYFIPEKAVSVK